MSYSHVKRYRRRNKELLLKAFGGTCCICGYGRCARALEFHHVDPKTKQFRLAAQTHLCWEKAVIEARKCILVCANCHAELEAGLCCIPKRVRRIDEAFVSQITAERKRKKEYDACPVCGGEKPKKQKYCSYRCSGLAHRRVERPPLAALRRETDRLGFVGTGRKYGVTDNAIRKWLQD